MWQENQKKKWLANIAATKAANVLTGNRYSRYKAMYNDGLDPVPLVSDFVTGGLASAVDPFLKNPWDTNYARNPLDTAGDIGQTYLNNWSNVGNAVADAGSSVFESLGSLF